MMHFSLSVSLALSLVCFGSQHCHYLTGTYRDAAVPGASPRHLYVAQVKNSSQNLEQIQLLTLTNTCDRDYIYIYSLEALIQSDVHWITIFYTRLRASPKDQGFDR